MVWLLMLASKLWSMLPWEQSSMQGPALPSMLDASLVWVPA